MDEDAFSAMANYLDRSKDAIMKNGGSEVAYNELESRIAGILKEKLTGRDVVNLTMVKEAIGIVGYPEGYDLSSEGGGKSEDASGQSPSRKLYRDPDEKRIAGVCSGLSLYFDIDVVLTRVIFLCAVLCGTAGLWIYQAIWVSAPLAKTATQKCELRGIPANAENIQKFSKKA